MVHTILGSKETCINKPRDSPSIVFGRYYNGYNSLPVQRTPSEGRGADAYEVAGPKDSFGGGVNHLAKHGSLTPPYTRPSEGVLWTRRESHVPCF